MIVLLCTAVVTVRLAFVRSTSHHAIQNVPGKSVFSRAPTRNNSLPAVCVLAPAAAFVFGLLFSPATLTLFDISSNYHVDYSSTSRQSISLTTAACYLSHAKP